MNTKKLYLFFLLFLTLPKLGVCQMDYTLPPAFDQFFKSLYLMNPAIQDTSEKVSLSVGNRTLQGLFEGVTRFYVDGSVLIGSKGYNNVHLLGLQAITGKDGNVFSRNRFYFRYGYQIAMTKKITVSAGLAAGFVNFSTKSSAASGGGNASSFDASLGMWVKSKKLQLGFSCQQLLEPNLQPIAQYSLLPRIFNYNINYFLKISPNVTLNTYFHGRNQPAYTTLLEMAPILLWNKTLETGVNYKYKKGLALVGGFSAIKIYKGNVRGMVSYFINTSNLSGVSDSVLELSLGYALVR